MKQKIVLVILLSFFYFHQLFATDEYAGNALLLLLGSNTTAKEFKPVKEFWLLDKNFENNVEGIKLSVNTITDKVESVLIAGESWQVNGTTFSKCRSALPYGILLTDGPVALTTKLDEGQKLLGRNTLKFSKDKITIEVSFTDANLVTINAIKFFKEVPVISEEEKITEEKKISYSKIKNQEKYRQLEKSTFLDVTPTQTVSDTSTIAPFKKAILDVFKSYNESNFYSIKSDVKSSANFWNYQFTYSTKLKIPGEKFNMLYSFPFYQSPLDFVSIIKEADAVDQTFVSSYKAFEKKLMENFPAADGWVSSCIVNKESKALSDLQFNNDKYGSIVLDYSKNPKGKHILYLRFLLYSN